MIKLSYEDLNDAEFMSALDKLDNHSGWDAKTTWDYNKLKSVIDREMKKGRMEIAKLTAHFTEKTVDENGVEEMVFIEDEKTKRKMPKIIDEESYNAKFKEILEQEFEIKSNGINAERVIEAGLTNRQIRACERIISPEI